MIALLNYRGYTICDSHPGSEARYGAFKHTECWFESEDFDAVKAMIDEALDA